MPGPPRTTDACTRPPRPFHHHHVSSVPHLAPYSTSYCTVFLMPPIGLSRIMSSELDSSITPPLRFPCESGCTIGLCTLLHWLAPPPPPPPLLPPHDDSACPPPPMAAELCP